MRYGSVCSGIEAASVAWGPLGFRPAWFAEIAPFPSKVLAHHYPETTNHGSLVGLANRLTGSDRSIDLLVGGTPCQSFSVAGLRGGLADERGNLALEFARLAAALRPRWLLWENVPGVLSADKGGAFASLLRGLSELGYGLAWRVLDAQFFGLAQRRQRVFLVGHLGAAAAAGAVLFEPEGVRRDSPSRRKEGEDVAAAAGGSASRRGVTGTEIARCLCVGSGVDWETQTYLPVDIPESLRWPKQVAATLNASFSTKQGLEDQHALGGASWFVPAPTDEEELARLWRENDARLDVTASFDETQVTSRTNRSSCNPDTAALTAHGRPPSIAFNARQAPVFNSHVAGALDTDPSTQAVCVTGEVTHALRAEGCDASEDGTGRGTPLTAASSRVRRLTPRECERLQGFPSDYTAIPGAKDTPRYHALGNSMAVPVMAWIGRRIAMVDAILESQ